MREHIDGVPGTVFGAECAADAAIQVHFYDLLELIVRNPRSDLNAVNWAKNNADLAPRTAILVDDSKFWWRFFTRRLRGNRFLDFSRFIGSVLALIMKMIGRQAHPLIIPRLSFHRNAA